MDTLVAAERHTLYFLVVDADLDNRFKTSMLLQRFGYPLSTATSAEEALELMSVVPPAVILADAANGLDLASRIKNDERLSHVPIIVMHKAKQADLENRTYKGDFAAYLEKPVDIKKLYRVIQSVVEKTPRENIRIETCLMAMLGEAAEERKGIVTVLSEYGMFFQTDEPLQLNERLPVSLEIKDRIIRLEAVVLYRYTLASGPLHESGMGMKFVNIDPKDQTFIWSYILEHIEDGITRLDR